MTKSDLIDSLYNHFDNWERQDVEASVNLIIKMMQEALGKGGRVEIRGFGTFSLNHRKARIGRNPKSGDSVEIPDKFAAHFRPGKELRERVNSVNK